MYSFCGNSLNLQLHFYNIHTIQKVTLLIILSVSQFGSQILLACCAANNKKKLLYQRLLLYCYQVPNFFSINCLSVSQIHGIPYVLLSNLLKRCCLYAKFIVSNVNIQGVNGGYRLQYVVRGEKRFQSLFLVHFL